LLAAFSAFFPAFPLVAFDAVQITPEMEVTVVDDPAFPLFGLAAFVSVAVPVVGAGALNVWHVTKEPAV